MIIYTYPISLIHIPTPTFILVPYINSFIPYIHSYHFTSLWATILSYPFHHQKVQVMYAKKKEVESMSSNILLGKTKKIVSLPTFYWEGLKKREKKDIKKVNKHKNKIIVSFHILLFLHYTILWVSPLHLPNLPSMISLPYQYAFISYLYIPPLWHALIWLKLNFRERSKSLTLFEILIK